MKGNDLDAQEVVPRSYTRGKSEVVPAVVCYHGVDRPCTSAQAGFGNLEPAETRRASASSVADFGQVDNDGTYDYTHVSISGYP